jgi:hypothetical protein
MIANRVKSRAGAKFRLARSICGVQYSLTRLSSGRGRHVGSIRITRSPSATVDLDATGVEAGHQP